MRDRATEATEKSDLRMGIAGDSWVLCDRQNDLRWAPTLDFFVAIPACAIITLFYHSRAANESTFHAATIPSMAFSSFPHSYLCNLCHLWMVNSMDCGENCLKPIIHR